MSLLKFAKTSDRVLSVRMDGDKIEEAKIAFRAIRKHDSSLGIKRIYSRNAPSNKKKIFGETVSRIKNGVGYGVRPKGRVKGRGVSLGVDKNGYFVYTHRARSKSYKSEDSIPLSKIKFIESTG